MDIKDFVLSALGMQLQDVMIVKVECCMKTLSSKITLRQHRQSACCGQCGNSIKGVHQWRKKELWGVPLGAFQFVSIIYFQIQGFCLQCHRMRLSKTPWIHPKFKQMTTAFAEYCGRWMEETTCAAVERMTKCPAMSLWRLDQWRMKKMKKLFILPTDLPISLASADEVHMYTQRPHYNPMDKENWKKKFITNLVSYDLSKVIVNANGRSSQSLRKCLEQLPEELRQRIKFIAVDMHDGYIKAAAKLCPHAEIAVDRFHVAQDLNRAFDEVRRGEFELAKQNKDDFQQEMLMPSKRFILMERKRDLSTKDQKRLDTLRQLNQNIHTGMLLIEYFHRILDKKSVAQFRKGLKLWEELVNETSLKPFYKFLKTVKKYQDRIEIYIRSRLTTAVSEGINNKIKVLKRVGYTYTNQISFKNKILQRCGLLNSRNILTNQWYWQIM